MKRGHHLFATLYGLHDRRGVIPKPRDDLHMSMLANSIAGEIDNISMNSADHSTA